nr:alkaline phosphatase [uncultured Flavobacterium sp.]
MKNTRSPFYVFVATILLVLFSHPLLAQKKHKKNEEPLSIIFMIGDGMGLAQVSSAFYFNDSVPNFSQFKTLGLSKTSCTSHKITDSAAGATAFSIGQKTFKRAIGLTKDTLSAETILETLSNRGYKTGLVCLTAITHATPASFYAHENDRDANDNIALHLLNEKVDFFSGGGLKFFNKRKDGRDLIQELENKNYKIHTQQEPFDPSKKNGYLLADEGIPSKIEGRKAYLQEATQLSLDYLDAQKKPFFLMVEGSYIDWGGHDKNADLMIQEVLDFDKTIGVVLQYIKKHPNTLLVITADHETGGASLDKFYEKNPITGKEEEVPSKVAVNFSSNQHTTILVPVFAKGKSEELFSGIYENNEIYHKMMQALNINTIQLKKN